MAGITYQLKKMRDLGLIGDNDKPVTSHGYKYVYKEGKQYYHGHSHGNIVHEV